VLSGGSRAALIAVAADFQAGDYDVEVAIALDLPLEAVEKTAFEFRNFAAAKTGHVDVVSLGATLVVMFLALEVHEVKFIDQAVAFEETQGPIDRHTIDLGINLACVAQDLAGVEMLLGGFHYAQNSSTLPGHAHPTRHQFRLQASWRFSLGQRHRTPSFRVAIELQLFHRRT
jgi:hypothetical protein